MGMFDTFGSNARAALTSSTNAAVSNLTGRASEALDKLKSGGIAGAFNRLTGGVDIAKVDGALLAVNSTTKEPIAAVAEKQEQIPASLTPTTNEKTTADFKVKIVSDPHWYFSTEPNQEFTNEVIFKVMPTISETQNATYDDSTMTPLHHPGGIVKYRTTTARTWNITAKLIARSPDEALENLIIVNTIRSWTMPFYGVGTANDPETKEWLGAPPPVLTLSAYGNRTIGPVKCVLESYSWTWPDDVDFIQTYAHPSSENTQTGVMTPFPVLMTVQLSLKESWSPAEFSSFKLVDYRKGYLLGGAFNSANGLAAASEAGQQPQTTVPDASNDTPDGPSDPARVDRSSEQTATDSSPVPYEQYGG